jgi:hypothetical protein
MTSDILGAFLTYLGLTDAKGIGVAQPTYMVVRLSDVSSKTGKKCSLCFLRCF